MSKASIDDLFAAAEWLRHYEPAPNDPHGPGMLRVAAQLEAQATRREEEASIRRIARGAKTTPARVRAALAKARP